MNNKKVKKFNVSKLEREQEEHEGGLNFLIFHFLIT